MLVPLSFGKGLDNEVKNNILKRNYSEEDLKQIYKDIMLSKEEAKTAFITDAIIMFIALAIITYKMSNGFKEMVVFGVSFMLIVYVICLGILYYSLFRVQKKQFLNAIKKAYPELIKIFK